MEAQHKTIIFKVETHHDQIVPTRGIVINLKDNKLLSFTNELPRPATLIPEVVSNHNFLIVKVTIPEEMSDEQKEKLGIDKNISFKISKEIAQFDLNDLEYKTKLLQFINNYIETVSESNDGEE